MARAFKTIDKEAQEHYVGRTCFFTSRDHLFHKGICKGFNEDGIIIEWITHDPDGFCVGTVTYPNVEGSIEEMNWE